MDEWQELLVGGIRRSEDLPPDWSFVRDGVGPENVETLFPIRVNSYYQSLIERPEDPIGLQVLPDPEEWMDGESPLDPLGEDEDSPVPSIVHRYPDRVLFLVTNQCPIYCRYCTRKRLVGKPEGVVTREEIRQGIAYIREHPEVRDVILSGGDPLMLKDELLEEILSGLRSIPHLEIIRIGTRVPSALPQRVTPALCEMLKRYHPLYMNLHFNHPREITPESSRACSLLADAGIPLGCQTVLMKGINDDAGVLATLFKQLLRIRVKPYYLYQADLTRGANHFRTPLSTGLSIMRELQGHISGMAIPHFVIDAPGGGGKIPVLPDDYLVGKEGENIILKNYENKLFSYPDVDASPSSQAEHNRCSMDSIGNMNGLSASGPMEIDSGPSLFTNGPSGKDDRSRRVPGVPSAPFTKPADRSPL
ncbi:MAG: KamA family radical SAM protein [Nitrospiraceae bacterium]|nr:KamA family radical SAM protein [Nitrospirota bacterium]MDA8149744.1 KamA family radical SAM protein [Nitrospiraceae bacterium]